ncbi:uncharacterized protein KY384_008677 [Bacidia gigantensis]|uniref:uncharacterized protein n=1 Tax=Bacidia gigantensis TaxID=2732470 RepID=UPI001D046CD5|nr:uncharacterized protein KY384_008677 [Bacidia gigantensis]KAG8526477.1 hypothetical protein KY384_008677 [Bacidia gigantensis]
MPIRQSPGHWTPGSPRHVPAAVGSKHEQKRSPEQSPSKNRNSPSLQEDLPSHELSGHQRHSGDGAMCSDRAELIERIKRGESPTWVPSQTLQQEYLKDNREPIPTSSTWIQEVHPPLIPSLESESTRAYSALTCNGRDRTVREDDRNSLAPSKVHSPFEIERPRSALHSGDFNHDLNTYVPKPTPIHSPDNTEAHVFPTAEVPWYPSSPPSRPHDIEPFSQLERHNRRPLRARAPSLNSFSTSSYVLKKPTTPLVQQSNNTDLDLSDRDRSSSPDKRMFRHSLYPGAFRNPQSESSEKNSSPASSLLSRTHRREASFPSVHQSRRLVTSSWILQPSSPPTPAFQRSRRTSFSSEASSRRRASMIGSYEESILRGRMSTAPSKPFDFHAHIGVLGRGKRPKMPPHVTVPFQAVFYDWSVNSDRTAIHDEPSPYVGNIELQNAKLAQVPSASDGFEFPATGTQSMGIGNTAAMNVDRPVEPYLLADRKRKRMDSFKPHVGSYRIPQQGQIQVVVKNPYKTALKLFLVPYDLTGMQPSQKTFVRQRYYSSGPIIERPIPSSPRCFPADSENHSRPILRYLIHLNICCSAKNHYYLYQHIRVVFANRVPDDQERLTKDIQEPKPKYSVWKPLVDPLPTQMSSFLVPADATPSRAAPEYSSVDVGSNIHGFNVFSARPNLAIGSNPAPVPPIPFQWTPLPDAVLSRGTNDLDEVADADTSQPTSASKVSLTSIDGMGQQGRCLSSDSGDSDGYTKLQRGDLGYGGFFGRASTPEPGEGLLTRRLRGLDVHRSSEVLDREELPHLHYSLQLISVRHPQPSCLSLDSYPCRRTYPQFKTTPPRLKTSIRLSSTLNSLPFSDPRTYTVQEIQSLAASPLPARLIIDVREPSELRETGRIPGAVNMPITSNADAFYLGEEDFLERFGFEKPRAHGQEAVDRAKSPFSPKMKAKEASAGLNQGEGDSGVGSEGREHDSDVGGAEREERAGVEEVIFYCKAGVRSRTAARLAREWQGVKVGDMTGGWNEWSGKGGAVERE